MRLGLVLRGLLYFKKVFLLLIRLDKGNCSSIVHHSKRDVQTLDTKEFAPLINNLHHRRCIMTKAELIEKVGSDIV